jgi:signal transduction histidine kinase
LEVKDEALKRYLDIRMRPIRTQRSGIAKSKPDTINDEANRIYESFAVLVIHDITERRQAKESLAEAYGELEETQQELIRIEKLALLGKFSSGIAHEIRNPLANIRASAQFCLAQYKLNKEIKKHLGIMLRNSEHANKIIKDLIDLAKPSEVSLKAGKTNDMIKRVCDLVRTRCEKQHVLVHTKVSRRLPPILMDEERMEKAFLNFVLNALDAMPKGGKLSMNVYPHFDRDKIVITIQDTGKGIPQEDLDNIFHPFFTTKRTGIGLGLCLADQVISSHKGRLSVTSKVGEGTMITIELPIARES